MNITKLPQPSITTSLDAVRRSLSPWKAAYRDYLNNKVAVVSSAFLLLVMVLCLCAPHLTSYDPMKINLDSINKPPSPDHWLGTDKGGRDIVSRLLYGGRVTLMIVFSTTLLITAIGTCIGSIAGYFGGVIDSLLMRFTDFIYLFPFLIFVIVLKTIIGEADIAVLIITISLLSWGVCARLVRSKMLSEKENQYVMAAISIGCPPYKVIYKHLLPNMISTIIVQAVLIAATMIAVETSLSFLGFGVPANVPSWGNMMSDAIRPEVLKNQWWVWLPAGLLITFTILSINFIGDGLKDASNTR